MTDERWLPVPEYEGYYEVSDHGNVRSVDRKIIHSNGITRTFPGRVLKKWQDKGGYWKVGLSKNGELHFRMVHRLVLSAFVGQCPKGMEGCHNDGNPGNPHLGNLRWDTYSNNQKDRRMHGTQQEVRRTHCPRGHVLESPNLVAAILKRGRRSCLACCRARSYTYHRPQIKNRMQEISDSYYQQIIYTQTGQAA